MRQFLDEDFLLSTQTAKRLYAEVADLPIIDYHCHIDPKEIYEDRVFSTITQVWLGGDHYKWRVLRAAGAPEELVTGSGDDREKFRAYASVMPKLMGNPLYHWSHLELQRYFGITTPLSPATADEIYDRANEQLKDWSARKFIQESRVKALCTTDDPADTLLWHEKLAADPAMKCRVLPAFRPDKAINLEKPGYPAYIARLSQAAGMEIRRAADVVSALKARIGYFAEHGCLCADHGLDRCMYAPPREDAADRAFLAAMEGKAFSPEDGDAFKTFVTVACAREYQKRGWVMQMHFGCLRENNKQSFRTLGPDAGFDAVNSQSGVENLAPLLNEIEEQGGLPKMIFYSLSPLDNTAIVTAMQCFQGGTPGKLQLGAAWWFNDSRPGMRRQLEKLAANGVLGYFVGMLTDSRSFLSYTRHEYFRRVLCELIGEWVEGGQYPDDWETLRGIAQDICYNNTNRFFGFDL